MSFEYHIDDVEYDTGYGVQHGTLVVEVDPVVADQSFDAYNGMGVLQSYGGMGLEDVEVLGATLFLVGNNGEELGEVEFPGTESLDSFKWLQEDLFNRVSEEDLSDYIRG